MTPRVVAIAGGKGGVGKSLVAANVGIFLATLGKKVVLVDGAFGAANLHIFAGVPRPSRTLSEVFVEHGPTLSELAVVTHVPGVRLVAGVYDPPSIADPRFAAPLCGRSSEACARMRRTPAAARAFVASASIAAVAYPRFLCDSTMA